MHRPRTIVIVFPPRLLVECLSRYRMNSFPSAIFRHVEKSKRERKQCKIYASITQRERWHIHERKFLENYFTWKTNVLSTMLLIITRTLITPAINLNFTSLNTRVCLRALRFVSSRRAKAASYTLRMRISSRLVKIIREFSKTVAWRDASLKNVISAISNPLGKR